MLPTDLRHYRRSDDLGAFQVIARNLAAAILIALGALILLFWPYTMGAS